MTLLLLHYVFSMVRFCFFRYVAGLVDFREGVTNVVLFGVENFATQCALVFSFVQFFGVWDFDILHAAWARCFCVIVFVSVRAWVYFWQNITSVIALLLVYVALVVSAHKDL